MNKSVRPAKKTDSPVISVIIPLYNHEDFIKETILSVLNQSYSDLELLIIDDGSTDKSAEIVREITDDRIIYTYQENRGAHKALNRGIKAARGAFVSILNSDDVYHRDRLSECVHALNRDDSAYAVFTYLDFIDRHGEFIKTKYGAEDHWRGQTQVHSFRGDNVIILDLLAGNFPHTTSNLFCRKEVFEQIGYFADLRYLHDYDFFLRLAYKFKIAILKKPLLSYRFHEGNTLNEDFAASNFETGLVLANFLMNYDFGKYWSDDQYMTENMVKFLNSLNTYHTDRIIMTMFLFGLKYDLKDKIFPLLSENPDDPFRAACIDYISKHREKALIAEARDWHKAQEELWWATAQKNKIDLAWQKEQSEKWWKSSKKLEYENKLCQEKIAEMDRACSWQKRETDKWWATAEELKRDLAWQKETLLLTRSEKRDLEQRLNLYLKLTAPLRKIFPPGSMIRKWFKKILERL